MSVLENRKCLSLGGVGAGGRGRSALLRATKE